MPFPFLPAGAALALAVLGGAFAVFWLLVRLLARAGGAARDSVAPGLVAGLRTWGRDDRTAEDGADRLAGAAVEPGGRHAAGTVAAADPEAAADPDVDAFPAEELELSPGDGVETRRVHRG